MSTKIWVAYKIRRADHLWPVVHDIRLRATQNVQSVLRQLYLNLIPEVKTDTPLFQKRLERYKGDEWRARFEVARDLVRRGYRMNTTSSLRGTFNFDVSVGFRQFEGGVYLIPYCDTLMRQTLDFLRKDKRLRDFHYQNQVDQPKNISDRVWKERRRVWFGMEEADRWKDLLVLDICKWDMFYQLDPWLDVLKSGRPDRSGPVERGPTTSGTT